MVEYVISGVRLKSEIDIPIFEDISNPERGDTYFITANLTVGECPTELQNSARLLEPLSVNNNEILVQTPNGGLIHSCDETITINPLAAMDMDVVADYSAAIFFPMFAYKSGRIPLHAAAIESDKGIVLICGASGMGKSTLAARLSAEKGYTLLHDDLIILDPSMKDGVMRFGLPRLKLWSDSVDRLGLDRSQLKPDRARPGKFHQHFISSFEKSTSNIKAIIQLDWGNCNATISELKKTELLVSIMNSTYIPSLAYYMSRNSHIRSWGFSFADILTGISYTRRKEDKNNDLQIAQLISFIKKGGIKPPF